MSDTVDLERRAAERGWPAGLLDRVSAIKTPSWVVEHWLSADGIPTEAVAREVELFESLATSRLRVRDLTVRDLDGFADLWARSPERLGEFSVTVERSPNPIAQFLLQGDVSVTVIEDQGELVACVVWATTNCLVAGAPASVLFAQGLRVREGRRREGFADLVRRYPGRALQRPHLGQVLYMRAANEGVRSWMEAIKYRDGLEKPRDTATVAYIGAQRYEIDCSGVRATQAADAARCAELINSTHGDLDLFRPLGPESFTLQMTESFWGPAPPWRPHVYGWGDHFVVERNGRIVACAGLWDRGRDVQERWRDPGGRTSVLAYTNLLDFGYEDGAEADFDKLVRFLVDRTSRIGRDALVAPLEHLPEIVADLTDLNVSAETRTIEWSPAMPGAPRALGKAFADLRFW